MCDITDKIEVLTEGDKNNKAIILLSKLIEDRFEQIKDKQTETSEELQKLNKNIRILDMNIRILEENNKAIQNNKEEIVCLKKAVSEMDTLHFFSRHPKLGIIFLVFVILGVLLAYVSGIDTIFLLF